MDALIGSKRDLQIGWQIVTHLPSVERSTGAWRSLGRKALRLGGGVAVVIGPWAAGNSRANPERACALPQAAAAGPFMPPTRRNRAPQSIPTHNFYITLYYLYR